MWGGAFLQNPPRPYLIRGQLVSHFPSMQSRGPLVNGCQGSLTGPVIMRGHGKGKEQLGMIEAQRRFAGRFASSNDNNASDVPLSVHDGLIPR